MSKDKRGNRPVQETNEFGSVGEPGPEGVKGTDGAEAPVVEAPAATTGKKSKKPRTPIETRIAAMFRGERAQYYSLHLTSLKKQIEDLKTLVGPEAVELAEKEFLQK